MRSRFTKISISPAYCTIKAKLKARKPGWQPHFSTYKQFYSPKIPNTAEPLPVMDA